MNIPLIGLFFILTVTLRAQAQEECTYAATNLNFEVVPGQVCVNTFERQLKPEFLEFITPENHKVLKAEASSIGSTTPLYTPANAECIFREMALSVDRSAFKKHCHSVENINELKLAWNQAIDKQRIDSKYADFYKLQTDRPKWTELMKRLKEINLSNGSAGGKTAPLVKK